MIISYYMRNSVSVTFSQLFLTITKCWLMSEKVCLCASVCKGFFFWAAPCDREGGICFFKGELGECEWQSRIKSANVKKPKWKPDTSLIFVTSEFA